MPANQQPRKQKLLEILKQQNYCCALTGRTLTPNTAAIDHVIPILRGGAVTDFNNIQILNADVNRAKGNMTDEEFRQLCKEVTQHHHSEIRVYSLSEYGKATTKDATSLFSEIA